MWEYEYIYSLNNVSVSIRNQINKQKLQLQNTFIIFNLLEQNDKL